MFPDYLDGAKVLEYTDRGHYGFVTDFNEDDFPIEKEICYYAIAQYENDTDSFYVFSCDESFEVFGDGHRCAAALDDGHRHFDHH